MDYTSAYRGALPGVALGDALGRPGEDRSSTPTQGRYGELRDFHPWRGWQRGPKGTITDGTPAATCPTRSIVGRGRLDPDDLAHPFADWLDDGQDRAALAAGRDPLSWEWDGPKGSRRHRPESLD